MDIKFIFNKKDVQGEFSRLQSFLFKMRDNRIPYYFPFTATNIKNHKYITNKIKKDINNLVYKRKYLSTKKEWLKLKNIIINFLLANPVIKKYGKLRSKYICIMTPYGPQGYYNPPNTIVVSIKLNKNSDIFETIVHELIHLILYDRLKSFSYKKREKTVDDIILKSNFKNIFTKYKSQKF